MDQNLLEQYKKQMLDMYRKSLAKTQTAIPVQTPSSPQTKPSAQPSVTQQDTGEGMLIGIVSTIRTLYPVPNAKVTIFTGSVDDKNIIATALTDQSGRTTPFVLPTPEKSLSLNQNNAIIPYAVYNMLIEADGYINNIHLNIPVFSGVTSLQRSNLMLKETAGVDKGPQIFDESEKYDL